MGVQQVLNTEPVMVQAAMGQRLRYPTPNWLFPLKPAIPGLGEPSSRPLQRKADHFVNYQAGSSADDNYGASGTKTHSKI